MWALLELPQFGGAIHANDHDNWFRYRRLGFLGTTGNPATALDKRDVETMARSLGLEFVAPVSMSLRSLLDCQPSTAFGILSTREV